MKKRVKTKPGWILLSKFEVETLIWVLALAYDRFPMEDGEKAALNRVAKKLKDAQS